MKRIIGVNSNCYHGYNMEDALEGIAAAGFHYVELTATKGWTEHVFPSQSFAYLVQVKEHMKRLGLIPFAMSGHCNLMDKERLLDFIMNIRLAATYGCVLPPVHPNPYPYPPDALPLQKIRYNHTRRMLPTGYS